MAPCVQSSLRSSDQTPLSSTCSPVMCIRLFVVIAVQGIINKQRQRLDALIEETTKAPRRLQSKVLTECVYAAPQSARTTSARVVFVPKLELDLYTATAAEYQGLDYLLLLVRFRSMRYVVICSGIAKLPSYAAQHGFFFLAVRVFDPSTFVTFPYFLASLAPTRLPPHWTSDVGSSTAKFGR